MSSTWRLSIMDTSAHRSMTITLRRPLSTIQPLRATRLLATRSRPSHLITMRTSICYHRSTRLIRASKVSGILKRMTSNQNLLERSDLCVFPFHVQPTRMTS